MTAPHRMLQDILDQPASLTRVLDHQSGPGRTALERAAAAIRSAGTVVVTGMGASLYSAMPLAFELNRAGRAVALIDAGELLHFGGELARNAVVIAVSRSGETVEIVRLLPRLRDCGATVIGIYNEPDTTLARESAIPIVVNAGKDEAVAVQSYTGSAFVSLLLASLVTGRDAWAEAEGVPYRMMQAIESERPRLDDWSAFTRDSRVVYLLGRGPTLATAHEGALLFNETAKLPSAAMASGNFRHGAVEVVDSSFCAVVVGPGGPTEDLDVALSTGLRRMRGQVRTIGPTAGMFAPVLDIVPLQFAAYAAAVARRIRPGRFRHVSLVTTSETDFRSDGR